MNNYFGLNGNKQKQQPFLMPDTTISRNTVRQIAGSSPQVRRALELAAQYCFIKNNWNTRDLHVDFSMDPNKVCDILNSDKKNVLEINVVKSTNKIADMCEKIKPVSDEKYYLRIKNAEVEIKDLEYKGAHRIYGNSLSIKVQERLDKELKSIIENDYATLYMIAQKIVEKANEDGYIMGFRGAVGSSLVAYYMRYNRN